MLVGVDWGGTKIEAIAMEHDGRSIARLREETPRSDYEGCLATVASVVKRVEAEAGASGSVGIGIPGSVDPRTGLAKGASSTWLNGKPVETDLRRALGRGVRIANDADCFAVSEAIDGAGAGHNVVFAVILGSGAGAGVAVAGKAHHGPNNSAGEWGHNPLPRPDVTEIPGPACYCGKHGCLETWISGSGLEADYERTTGAHLAGREILALSAKGDAQAEAVVRRYESRLTRGLAHVINVLDPDVIVLGGGMSRIERLYPALNARLKDYIFGQEFATPIRPALHGDSSGIRGAAWLWPKDVG